MKNVLARVLLALTMVVGLGVSSMVASSADTDAQAQALADFKESKSDFEEALDTYKKAPNSTKAAKSAKAALKVLAVNAQKRAESARRIALQQAFATYTGAISRANSNYVSAMAAAGKSAALKNAAINAKKASVAAATATYNAAKNELKASPKVP